MEKGISIIVKIQKEQDLFSRMEEIRSYLPKSWVYFDQGCLDVLKKKYSRVMECQVDNIIDHSKTEDYVLYTLESSTWFKKIANLKFPTMYFESSKEEPKYLFFFEHETKEYTNGTPTMIVKVPLDVNPLEIMLAAGNLLKNTVILLDKDSKQKICKVSDYCTGVNEDSLIALTFNESFDFGYTRSIAIEKIFCEDIWSIPFLNSKNIAFKQKSRFPREVCFFKKDIV